MRISLSDIPGFQADYKRENDYRDAAFVDGLTTNICGVEIRQMTPQDFILLDGVGNPLVVGGLPTPEQLTFFLWILSPEYRPKAPFRAWLFGRRCSRLPYWQSVTACLKYLEITFQDSPGGASIIQRQFAGWCAHLVTEVALNLPWSERDILSMPFRRLFQYLKCIRKYQDPQAPMHNPSDKKVSEYMKLKNARNKLLAVLRNKAGIASPEKPKRVRKKK